VAGVDQSASVSAPPCTPVRHDVRVGEPSTERGLRVTSRLVIPWDEIDVRVTTSGGPGGQHANRSLTAVEVRFDVASSSIGPTYRERLLQRVGPVVRARASEQRSQSRNRQLAMDRLAARLAAGVAVDPERRPTRPGRGAVERRLDGKRQASERKAARRRPTADD
jgi:ribosome-associated protein